MYHHDSMNRKRNRLLYLLSMGIIPLVAGLVVITMVNKEACFSRSEKVSNHENSTLLKKTFRFKAEGGLSPETVQIMLRNKGISDSRRNSVGTGISHEFEAQNGGTVVYDRATGLLWQQSGSQSDMNYERAKNYISELNHEQFAGYNDWRLPTLEEAMSLMEPTQKNNNLHIGQIFDSCQMRIWTSDFRRDSMSWVVRFDAGYCDYGVE